MEKSAEEASFEESFLKDLEVFGAALRQLSCLSTLFSSV
jgi:hypothetical protein